MADLGWTADGIERALACGGVLLEKYQRPGFTGGTGVRRSSDTGGSGFPVEQDDELAPWYRRGGGPDRPMRDAT